MMRMTDLYTYIFDILPLIVSMLALIGVLFPLGYKFYHQPKAKIGFITEGGKDTPDFVLRSLSRNQKYLKLYIHS